MAKPPNLSGDAMLFGKPTADFSEVMRLRTGKKAAIQNGSPLLKSDQFACGLRRLRRGLARRGRGLLARAAVAADENWRATAGKGAPFCNCSIS
jgi:hypothetical protein